MRRALSLVEIVLALLVLGLAVLPILQVFSTTGRQAQQTAEYGLAITLQERVAEHLRVGSWENPHRVDDLLGSASGGVPLGVVDGGSPYFRTLEDSAEPFGRILEGSDAGITRTAGPLYARLRDFQIGTSSFARTLPETGAVADVRLAVTWVGADRTARQLEALGTLPRHSAAHASPDALRDRAAADEKLARLLYPDRPGTLASLIAGSGADAALIQLLGEVGLLVGGLLDGDEALESELATMAASVPANGPPGERARQQMLIARRMESRTAAYLQAIMYLAPQMRTITATPPRTKLGNPPPAVNAWGTPVLRIMDLAANFDAWAWRTLDAYHKAYDPPLGEALPQRTRIRVLLKMVELEKLRVLTVGPADTTYLRGLLTGLSQYEEGRRSNFHDLASVELSRTGTVADVERWYAAPERFRAFREFVTGAPPAATALLALEGGAP